MRAVVFGRKNAAQPESSTLEPQKDGGKGRPTPTRKEAEAASRERAKSTLDPKGAARQQRVSQGAKMRQAMRTGDERYLPARDQGPVKRFVRDWIDRRLTFVEFVLPSLVIVMMLTFNKSTFALGNLLEILLVLIVAVEVVYLSLRLRSALRTQFPGEDTRGTTSYLLMRAMQLRQLRMPKTQVKIGGERIDRSAKSK